MNTTIAEPQTTERPPLLLADHHRALEDACRGLLVATYSDDSLELIEEFRAFESAVATHLGEEESSILPAYSEADPVNAQLLREDHDAIRRQLRRVGLEVELHVVRAHTIQAMIDLLRRHAEHEDTSMYPWAEENLSPTTRRGLFERIALSLKTLLDRRRPAAAS